MIMSKESVQRAAANKILTTAMKRSHSMSVVAAGASAIGNQRDHEPNLVDKLSKFAGEQIKPGRNVIKGYPVDIEDGDPAEGVEMDAVDRDAATGLLKALRSAGFKTRRVGDLGIVVVMSNTPVAAGVPSPSSQNLQALERAADDIASIAMTLTRLSTQLNTMNRTVFMAGDSPG